MKTQTEILPREALRDGLLVGRVWHPAPPAGPRVVMLGTDGVHDVSHLAQTLSQLLERPRLCRELREAPRDRPLCSIGRLLDNSACGRAAERRGLLHLLAPSDLGVIKACGVTFAASALERVIEERTRGDPKAAAEARRAVSEWVGGHLTQITPGSQAAEQLKVRLVKLGMWSQYLEVALGADAEVFTKASPLSAVGHGAAVGILRTSVWNNPEPEVVLAVNSRAETVGATLGNDVNLRDIEGRSALLLGRAKDNNGSCAIGPAIRLFDESFTVDDVRSADVTLQVVGPEGFALEERSAMGEISRDPLDLVSQTIGAHHQYPDGLMLFLGSMFSPIQDRDAPGLGFTHRVGDRVTISTPCLGALVNQVDYCDAIPPWTFGFGELLRHLQQRALSSAS